MRKGVLSRFICLFLSVLMVVAIPLSSLSSLTLRADIIPEDYSWNKITWDTVKMNLNYVADDEVAAEIASVKMPNAAKYDWVVYSVDEEGGYSAIWFDGSNWRYQSGTFTFDEIIANVNNLENWYVIGDATYTTDFNWNSMSMKSTTITCDSGVDFDAAVTIASNHIRYSSEYAMVAYSYKGADEYLCIFNYTGSWEPTTLSFEDLKECIRADDKVYVIGTETHNDKLPSSYNWSDCENCILDVTFDGVSTDEAIALAKYYFPGGQDVRIYYDFDGVYLYYIKWNSEENSWENVKSQTSAMTKVINAFYEKSYVIGKVVELGSNYSQYSFQKVTDSSYGLFPYTGITTDRAIEFADYKINNGVKIDCLVYGNFNGYKVLTYNGNDWVNGTGYTYDRIKELVNSGLSIYVIGYADECSVNKFSKTDSGIDFDRIISVEEAATIASNIVDNPIEHDLFVYSYSEQSGKYSYLIYYSDRGWTRYGLNCDMQKLFEYCDSYNIYTIGSPVEYEIPDNYSFIEVNKDSYNIVFDNYKPYQVYNIAMKELPNIMEGDSIIYSYIIDSDKITVYGFILNSGKLRNKTYIYKESSLEAFLEEQTGSNRFFIIGSAMSKKDLSISQIPDNAISLKVDAGIDSDTAILLAKSLATNPSKNDWLVYSATADGKYEAIWYDGESWRYQSGAFSLEDIKSEIKAGQKWYIFGSSEIPTPVTPEPTPDPTPATGVEGFCERLYTCALGRASDPAGVKSWVDAIKAGADGAKTARGFFFSPEFTGKNLDNKEYVTRLYKTFMDREPDAAGLAAWVEALEKGASREKVFDGFVNSQEWANICFKYGIKSGGTAVPNIRLEPSAEILAFAERLYTTCLGRTADPSGLKAWADALANREGSGAKVARGFFFSEEFVNKKYDNGEFVRRCYLTFMDREPDAGGYAAWVKALDEGASREKVFDGFTQSPEFVAICEKAGIIPFG